jgi:hypothetical protein
MSDKLIEELTYEGIKGFPSDQRHRVASRRRASDKA